MIFLFILVQNCSKMRKLRDLWDIVIVIEQNESLLLDLSALTCSSLLFQTFLSLLF